MWIWSERFSAPVGRSDRPHVGPKKSLRRCVSQTLSDVRWCRPGCLSATLRPRPCGFDSEKMGEPGSWGLPRNGMWCHRVDVFCPANLPKARVRVDVQCGMRVKALDFQHLLHGHESKNLWMKAEGDLSPAGKVLFSKRYWKEVDASVSSENACFFFSELFQTGGCLPTRL